MRIFILYTLLIFCSFLKAQSPFQSVVNNIHSDNFKDAERVLDSCSFTKYFQDSVLYYKGMLVLKKGNITGARIQCLLLQSTYPDFNEAHYLSALIYFTDENYGSSIDEFTHLLRGNPKHLKAFFNRSIAYGLLEDYSRAIDDLSSCIAIDPNYALAYYSRAYWYEYTGKINEAKKDYEQSILLDPKNYDAYYGLAYLYKNQKDTVKACEVINKATHAGSQIAEEIKDNFCR